MNAAMYKALSGALVQTRRLEMVTQDLANVNTAGYKGVRLVFREVLEGSRPHNMPVGGQVALSEQHTDLSNGNLRNTGNPLDFALIGDGLFSVQTPHGVRYTRQGAFSLSASHTVVTPSGEPLLGEKGPIHVDGTKVEVGTDGSVVVDGAPIDRLKIVQAEDARNLVREGANFFRVKDAEIQSATGNTQVLQGSIEDANVDPVMAMVSLIDVERQFEAYERAMRTMDETTEKVVNEAGKP